MRKLLIVAVLGMVLAIAACGPGAEPTPTPTSTPKVVATPTATSTTTPVVAIPTPTVKTLATPTATSTPVVATPTPTAKPLATATATPKRGGILKTRKATTVGNFYALQATGGGGNENGFPVYNTLVAQDPLDPTSEKIVPDLADRWEISGDGLTITLFLHQGIKWQDGVPFTAADVKYNLNLVRDPIQFAPAGFVSPRKGLYEAIASVEAPNDNTVVIKLKRISNSIMEALADASMLIMPKHLIEKDVLHSMDFVMVGTGPYLFKKLTPEGIMLYEKNPSYWKPGLPYLDGIQVIPIADKNAYLAALYSGQIDCNSSAGGAKLLGKADVQYIQKSRPELIQGSVSLMSVSSIALNTKVAPFTDQRVREAVQEALDRGSLVNTSMALGQVGGFKAPGSFWELPAQELAKLAGFGPDIKARRERARQLLKDAGIAAGMEITIAVKSNQPVNVEMTELAQLQLQEALPSLKFKIRSYASAEYDAAEEASNFQAMFGGKTLGGSDPDNYGILITTGGGRNYWNMSDPRIDELYAKQSTILDPAQRRLVVWELDKLVIQNSAITPIYWRADVCTAAPYVKNLTCAANPNGVGGRFEIVWLDK